MNGHSQVPIKLHLDTDTLMLNDFHEPQNSILFNHLKMYEKHCQLKGHPKKQNERKPGIWIWLRLANRNVRWTPRMTLNFKPLTSFRGNPYGKLARYQFTLSLQEVFPAQYSV